MFVIAQSNASVPVNPHGTLQEYITSAYSGKLNIFLSYVPFSLKFNSTPGAI